MGRKKKGWKPVITERNKWLADDFMKYIGTIYEEYRHKYMNEFMKSATGSSIKPDEDLFQDSILRVYQTILWNGCDKPVYITEDTPEEERHTIYRHKWFIALRQNSTVGLSTDKYRSRRDDNSVVDILKAEEYTSSAKKVMNDIYNDYRTMHLLDLVCRKYDAQTCYCFRIYYLVPGMTYKKLSNITHMKDAKTRVVEVNKYLRDNLDEISAGINEGFRTEYPDFDF